MAHKELSKVEKVLFHKRVLLPPVHLNWEFRPLLAFVGSSHSVHLQLHTHTVHNVHSCSLSRSTSSLSSAKEMASTLQQYCLASGGEANPIFVYNTHPALLMILLCNVQCTNGMIPSKQNNLGKHCSVHLTFEEHSGGGRAANYLCFCLRETCIL